MFNHRLYEFDTPYYCVILLTEWVATIVSSIITGCLRGFHSIVFSVETACDTSVNLLLSTLDSCMTCFNILPYSQNQHNRRKTTRTSVWYQQPSAVPVKIPYTSSTDAQTTSDLVPHISIVVV